VLVKSIATSSCNRQSVRVGALRVFYRLEDRQRTLDSPIDKTMMQLTAFADELGREVRRE
jgi:hypothetical protein